MLTSYTLTGEAHTALPSIETAEPDPRPLPARLAVRASDPCRTEIITGDAADIYRKVFSAMRNTVRTRLDPGRPPGPAPVTMTNFRTPSLKIGFTDLRETFRDVL